MEQRYHVRTGFGKNAVGTHLVLLCHTYIYIYIRKDVIKTLGFKVKDLV